MCRTQDIELILTEVQKCEIDRPRRAAGLNTTLSVDRLDWSRARELGTIVTRSDLDNRTGLRKFVCTPESRDRCRRRPGIRVDACGCDIHNRCRRGRRRSAPHESRHYHRKGEDRAIVSAARTTDSARSDGRPGPPPPTRRSSRYDARNPSFSMSADVGGILEPEDLLAVLAEHRPPRRWRSRDVMLQPPPVGGLL